MGTSQVSSFKMTQNIHVYTQTHSVHVYLYIRVHVCGTEYIHVHVYVFDTELAKTHIHVHVHGKTCLGEGGYRTLNIMAALLEETSCRCNAVWYTVPFGLLYATGRILACSLQKTLDCHAYSMRGAHTCGGYGTPRVC